MFGYPSPCTSGAKSDHSDTSAEFVCTSHAQRPRPTFPIISRGDLRSRSPDLALSGDSSKRRPTRKSVRADPAVSTPRPFHLRKRVTEAPVPAAGRFWSQRYLLLGRLKRGCGARRRPDAEPAPVFRRIVLRGKSKKCPDIRWSLEAMEMWFRVPQCAALPTR